MSYILLLFLALNNSGLSFPFTEPMQKKWIAQGTKMLSDIPTVTMPLSGIQYMLHREAPDLKEPVINKVLTTLKCAIERNLQRNNILTIIDYSLPSNQKRLWVFDLNTQKLLFNTYVSHGITSGALLTNYFSNKNNSKASSMGVYKTEKAYYGREGLSLRLDGLDPSFNDNASNRSIVMHGGWYVDEHFIKRYGRPGRSWGCPAVPLQSYQGIINAIKDSSLLIAYYPNDSWFEKSRFLNCEKPAPQLKSMPLHADTTQLRQDEPRDEVLFANTIAKFKKAEENPIVVMSANDYERIFQSRAPLTRMLRRQINHEEYIALSNNEFKNLAVSTVNNKDTLNAIQFVVPVLIMVRGYYETQMKVVNLGKIKDIRFHSDPFKPQAQPQYWIGFEATPAVSLKATNRFIRWVGL